MGLLSTKAQSGTAALPNPVAPILCKNMTGSSIASGKVVAWLDDGTIALADANFAALADIVGITAEIIPDGQFGSIARSGSVAGAVIGLSATVGDIVYLSETPGELTLTAPSGIGNGIIKLGRAEPASGIASPTATNLWLHIETVVEP